MYHTILNLWKQMVKRASNCPDTAHVSYYIKKRKRTLFLAAASSLFLMSVIFSMVSLRHSEEILSASIAPEILRFHVLANSDSDEDQSLKMEVKQLLINTMYTALKAETEAPFSKEAMSSFVLSHREELEQKAEDFMAERGFPYSASIRLERCYFPTKIYGDVVFPCGTYDAVRVLLGQGEGKNWWCVLYPPLCFTDNAYGEVPESSKMELKNLLDGDDFQSLMRKRRVVFGEPPIDAASTAKVTVRVKFRFPELFDILK